MRRAGQRTIADAVAVHILVAPPGAGQRTELFGVQHLAAIHRFLRILEPVGGPDVHADVQVAQDHDQGLEPFGQIESRVAELEALGGVGREEQGIARVAVAQVVRRQNVSLAGTRRQAGAGPDALDVPDHRRHLGEVGQPGELGHQIEAGARGAGHGARARPAGADHHADGRQLIFGLDHREGRLVGFGVGAQLGQVFVQSVHHAGGRCDRIPADHRDAAPDACPAPRPCCRRSGSCPR